MKTTPRDEPRSNPVAERDHRTSEVRATAMRLDSHLPPSFWQEMEMAEWVIRLVTPLPIGKYKGKTPYELALKRPPPRDFLHPIGCLAWVRLWESKKGMSMAVPGVLVRYNLFRRLYRIYMIDKQRVEEHRNVRFDHSVRGYTAQTSPQPWNIETALDEKLAQAPPTFSTDESDQNSREDRQISPKADNSKIEETDEDAMTM